MRFISFFSGILPVLIALIALIAGAAVPFQATSNAALGRALGHPLWSTFASLLVSLLVLIPLLWLMRPTAPNISLAIQGPWWLWFGGVAGVAYITVALILAPKIGVAGFMVSVIAGQMLASLFLDYTGIMGLEARPIGWGKIMGTLMMVAGMVCVQMSNVTAIK